MTPVHMPTLQCLLSCATDLMTVRIPEVRQKHGVGEQVELAVAGMWIATADCLDRALKILEEDGKHKAEVTRLANRIRTVLSEVEECYACAEGFRIAAVMAEADRATKH